MRAIFFITIILLLLTACSNKKRNAAEIKTQTYSTDILRSSDSSVAKTTTFPFGCDLIVHHKFPARWEVNSLEKKDPHVIEIYEVMSCYNNINTVKSIAPPVVKHVEYVPVQEYDQELYKDLPSRLSIDSCKYKLPDFGLYESYYSFNYNRLAREMGYLILYDRKSGTAKTLCIYNSIPGGGSASYRFFYINSDKTIQIFALDVLENEMYFKQTHSIKILEDGQINVTPN
jgi:hypothetical protein